MAFSISELIVIIETCFNEKNFPKIIKELSKEILEEHNSEILYVYYAKAKIEIEKSEDKLGSKKMPVTNYTDFLKVLEKRKKELHDVQRADKNFFLFRGMATDKFEIVGRINFDKQSLRDDVNEKIEAKTNDYVEKVEKEIFNSFRHRARIYVKNIPDDDWEWLALARHHAVPTRILDWSRDAQIALWFAVNDEPAFRHQDSVVCIFAPGNNFLIQHSRPQVFNTNNFQQTKYATFRNPFAIDDVKSKVFEDYRELNNIKDSKEQIILYRPSSITERIDYQSSWFTVHPFDQENNCYKKIEPDGIHKNVLRKIYIHHEYKHEIRRELARLGIDDAAIYKDLDNTGKYLKGRYFKMSDEFFTDDNLLPSKVLSTFDQLQGAIGLYNSKEVRRIDYMNVKGAYQKFITMLCDKNNPVKSFYTLNNMNREFLAYRNQRDLFLRLLENKVKEYKRIQFCNHYNIENDFPYKYEGEEEKDSIERKLFENIMVWTDGLSKAHVTKIKENVKYLVVKDSTFFTHCSFCLIERTDGKKDLILELNYEYLSRIIGDFQNMCFWIQIKDKDNNKDKIESNLIKKYNSRFFELFNLPTLNKENSDNYIAYNYNEAKQIISNKRDLLNKNLPKTYIKVNYKDALPNDNPKNLSDKEFKGLKKSPFLLIPIDNKRRLPTVHSLLDYIYYKLKHVFNLSEFSYGPNPDSTSTENETRWMLFKGEKELRFDSINAIEEFASSHHNIYKYYYGQSLNDSEFNEGGEIIFKLIH